MIHFACIAPHPPIILSHVGSKNDREQVKKTIESLSNLASKFKQLEIERIIISSPHPDWGFNVPLHFLAPDFKGEIIKYLTDAQTPKAYFDQGKEVYKALIKKSDARIALIASGDLSHVLKADGPYGFHSDGPKFDQALASYLMEKDIKKILNLNQDYPEAGECGLRSFSFILGILKASAIDWETDILSYEGPFGVGYLVAEFKL